MSQNPEQITLTIKRGPFDNKPRQLILDPTFISFEDDESSTKSLTKFEKNSITAYRFGVKWIRGFEFTVGREYQIFIRNNEGKILKINFKSFYGRKKQENYEKYIKIINTLWVFYFSDITNNLLQQFNETKEFDIGAVKFKREGLEINIAGLIKEEKKQILWDQVATRDYQTYFAIYSLDDKSKINRTYNYLSDWNTGVLYSAVRTILKIRDENN
ncbi:hypothetical protein FA048_14090 [Pedobacter polaris]|uniref:Uncharacterized protein n=1 Tax=Pedobacter polaris TaxID=2571273 RepID=A0A4U1CRA2_9SPHI|nr:hypothetical protein [Pedobacter polaris]TKC08282.1 hypothetical protein FA048_14090 [Pedobacter polaris]